jgi:hypothetical protein
VLDDGQANVGAGEDGEEAVALPARAHHGPVMSDDDQNLQTPPLEPPGGASARAWWNGGTDPHGTVYPDGHIEGGVTIDIPFGGSSGSGHAGPTSQPGPLDDPVSRSIERARQRALFGDDSLAPMSAPSEEMGDYPTPNNYPASDGDQEAAPDESYA